MAVLGAEFLRRMFYAGDRRSGGRKRKRKMGKRTMGGGKRKGSGGREMGGRRR
jgi:hypothetical protein